MPRGPLPSGNARRRNAPTIPTTNLPATGPKGSRAPKCPYELGDAGSAWWRWAWKQPQAAGWDAGSHYAIARRAQIEDHRAALQLARSVSIEDTIAQLLDEAGQDSGGEEWQRLQAAGRSIDFAVGQLKRLSGGDVALMKESRELDKRLGLDPKALAELRWTIVDPDAAATRAAASPGSTAAKKKTGSNVRKLRVVDAPAG